LFIRLAGGQITDRVSPYVPRRSL